MSTFTRRAIMDSCIRLLEEHPYDKLTVKDIVEDCGINRNTFYYHFADLPTLVKEIIKEATERTLKENIGVTSLWLCVSQAIEFILQHKRAVLHMYRSANRDVVEQYIFDICHHAVTQYIERAQQELPGVSVQPEDKRIIIQAYTCECVGEIIHWMNGGMKGDFSGDMVRLCKLREGATKEMLLRSACI